MLIEHIATGKCDPFPLVLSLELHLRGEARWTTNRGVRRFDRGDYILHPQHPDEQWLFCTIDTIREYNQEVTVNGEPLPESVRRFLHPDAPYHIVFTRRAEIMTALWLSGLTGVDDFDVAFDATRIPNEDKLWYLIAELAKRRDEDDEITFNELCDELAP